MIYQGAYIEQRLSITVTSVDGVLTYFIPVGNRVGSVTGNPALTIDGVSKVLSTDFFLRSRTSAPITVDSMKIGWILVANPGNGKIMVFSWTERQLIIPPPVFAKVRIDNGEVNYAPRWNQSDSSVAPNGFISNPVPSFRLEFWRYVRKNGGNGRERIGHRFIPFWRSEPGAHIFAASLFPSPSRRMYRVCYLDPASGARSTFSDTLVINAGRIDKNAGGQRAAYSVWIK